MTYKPILAALALLMMTGAAQAQGGAETGQWLTEWLTDDMKAVGALTVLSLPFVLGLLSRIMDRGAARLAREAEQEIIASRQPVIFRSYRSFDAFQRDAVSLGDAGYFPTSQSWTPGQWSAGQFLVALLLCVVLVGLLVFVYMLIVRPPGVLTVVYRLTAQAPTPALDQPAAARPEPEPLYQLRLPAGHQ